MLFLVGRLCIAVLLECVEVCHTMTSHCVPYYNVPVDVVVF